MVPVSYPPVPDSPAGEPGGGAGPRTCPRFVPLREDGRPPVEGALDLRGGVAVKTTFPDRENLLETAVADLRRVEIGLKRRLRMLYYPKHG